MSLSLPSLTEMLHIAQAVLSTYTSYYVYLSIIKTQTYEEKTKKAAQYSNTADYHLWKTRKTLGGGALGVFASLSTSASLLFYNNDSSSAPALALTSFAIALYLTFSHSHISNYWRVSPKIPMPGMKDYNDALTTTTVMRKAIGFLAVSWGIAGGLYLWDVFA